MQIVRDDSIHTFMNEAGPLLYKDEATHGLMLGLCEMLKVTQPKVQPVLLRIVENSTTVATALQTPPKNLILSYASPPQLQLVVEYLGKNKISIPGVVGPSEESETFADLWSNATTKKAELGMGQKIYKLEKVDFPDGVAGEMKVAQDSHLDLVTEWLIAFAKESLPPSEQAEAPLIEMAKNAVEKKEVHIWFVDGHPVSMARCSRPTANGVSVNAVYTPPIRRKNGYASAVVAHLSQKILDSGKYFCVLYTDLANPTSNKIYQEIGYRFVKDSKHFLFF